ncbi:MAG: amino acid adenylation domain-containing protein, partial [bacterium]
MPSSCIPSPSIPEIKPGRKNVPPSAVQEGFWFLANMEGVGSTHSVARTVRLCGPLNAGALARSLQHIVDRHDVLRTVFTDVDGQLQATVLPTLSVPLPRVDLSHLPEGAALPEAESRSRDAMQRPFDLARGPLLRFLLFRLQPDDHLLMLNFHHIIIDASTITTFRRELALCYQAFSADKDPDLPPLPLQYADYAQRQRARLTPEKTAALLDYWRTALEGAPALLELPTDYRRPRVQTFDSGNVAFTLSAELLQELRALRTAEGVSLFAVCLSAFQVLLMRMSGQEDVVVGVSHVDRKSPEVQPLIGCFVNMLPVRATFSDALPFREFLRQVQGTLRDAIAHHELPFQKLVENLVPKRRASYPPVFQASIRVLQDETEGLALTGLRQDYNIVLSGGTAYDLTLFVEAGNNAGSGRLEYNRALFSESTIHRMAGHFLRLLEGIVANPDEPIGSLPLLNPAEREQLLVQWNVTARDYPGVPCVHRLFEDQAARTPEAVALVFGDAEFTYRQLNAQANRLAVRLQALGVGPDVRVALCVERSIEMVVGLLAILKAGGAYVPIDPDYPPDRLEFMLKDSRTPLVLTQARLVDRVPVPPGAGIELLDEWAAPFTPTADPPNPPLAVGGDTLAYMIYTSGSTGQPKGVMIPHRALANHMQWMQSTFPAGPDDAVLQKTPFSFDASVWEFYAPLLAGGRLVLAQPGGHRDLNYLIEAIDRHQITILQLVPFLLGLLLENPRFGTYRSLRRVFCGGDALTTDLVRTFCATLEADLHNLYGPTEVTIDSVFHSIDRRHLPEVVPIGRPVANSQAYILDAHFQPVPIGAVGELYLGGTQVGLGYHNRPDLTAERFLPDPFRREPGARLFKTGDRARYQPDGTIEFMGRMDQMVKLRGCSIELGEVEAVLRQQAGVRQCAVLVTEVKPGDQRLVAYVVPETGHSPAPLAWGEGLRQKLPTYMIPSAYVALDALPLTPSGKLDRKALPLPAGGPIDHSQPTATTTEAKLAAIWARVFGIERVDRQDDFFSLGGHSLLAVQVAANVRDVFKVDLPLRLFFEAPTLADLANRLDELWRSASTVKDRPIRLGRQERCLPLSFAQQRLWFLDQLEPNSSVYNMPQALSLTGDLNVKALEQSLETLVSRHEALRTVFVYENNAPLQVILPPGPFSLALTDLGALPDEERREQVRQRLREEVATPFNLRQGPLFRAYLLRLTEQEHVLLLNLHHIISDAWSLSVLFHELSVLYKAHLAGSPSPLPDLKVQYADFAVWQRQWLQGETLERQLTYWKNELAGAPAFTTLPTDRPRPATQTHRGAAQSIVVPPELTRELQALSQREGCTLFMTLLAAFNVLLHRYTGQTDFVVGAPIAGRNWTEVEGLIGFFVNTLALRNRIDGADTFRELLARVREGALGAYAHQDLPFEKLVEALNPERDPGRNPLFQVLFALHNMPPVDPTLGGLAMQLIPVEKQLSKFDLSMSFGEDRKGLSGSIVFNADLFDSATIQRMAGHWRRLLESLVTTPDEPIGSLPMLTDRERHQLLVEWNPTQPAAAPTQCLHDLFEAQVDRTPEQVAVVFETRQLTYRELDRQANRLANRLRDCGIGPGIPVGICVERSTDMVVGTLAVFKAGGQLVPMTPDLPRERFAFILEETQIRVLLTQEAVLSGLPPLCALTICLDRLPDSPHPASLDVRVKSGVTRQDPAYIIYTSGSTGRPKGVVVTQGAYLDYYGPAMDLWRLTSLDRYLHFHTFGVDVAIDQILTPLLAGATVVMRGPDLWDPLTFTQRCREYGLTVVHLPPVYFQQWVESFDEQRAPAPDDSLRLVIVGGDVMPVTTVRRWQHRAPPGIRLINRYGPTEATLFSTAYEILAELPGGIAAKRIPIGKPLANRLLYILDPYGNPAPIGVTGEIHIGGGSLAQGYLNRPDLTAARFIPNPFEDRQGARLFRTGDLARHLPDGNIDFLGRNDFQVKIRGHRVEPDEIAAVMREHPGVRDGVVLTREDAADGVRLVAYWVAGESAPPTSVELRTFLKQKLPDYMVPEVGEPLSALPLSRSGKVDRAALPVALPPVVRPQQEYAAPRSAMEQALAGIWQAILNRDSISLHDDFFDLGGHSLKAVRVIAQIRKAFGMEIPVRTLFGFPTLAAFADQVEAQQRSQGSATSTLLLQPLPPRRFPLSFGQQRLWFLDQLEPNGCAYNMPQALSLTGVLNVKALEQSLETLVSRHEALRTIFVYENNAPLQLILPPGAFGLTLTDLSDLQDQERQETVRRRLREEAEAPFELTQGPLFRAQLLRLSGQEHILMLTLHHIIADGWSMSVLLSELGILYKTRLANSLATLPELKVQYTDFASWQRDHLQGDKLESSLGYWKKQLDSLPSSLDLPFNRPRPAVQTRHGARAEVSLSIELTRSLRALSRREGATLFMTLLAALDVLLHRITDQEDFAVGTPVAGRERTEFESLIGFFVNTLVLRSRVEGDPTFQEFLARVRECALDAYAHQDLPFEKLVESLNPERNPSRTPLFQVMFGLENLPAGLTELPGLKIGEVNTGYCQAKFDLTFMLKEAEQGITGSLVYNTDLFDPDTIRRLVGHWQTLLEGIIANPGDRISRLPLLQKHERNEILTAWNATDRPYPSDQGIHRLFEDQVKRTPKAPAVEFEGRPLTYRELNRRADQLACRLRSMGVGSESLVGICVERSPLMVIGMLGILKAGGAYVPLDPTYPKERLTFMLDDIQATVLLTQKSLVNRLPAHAAKTLCLDAEENLIPSTNQVPTPAPVTGDSLAYVIYTSGSTGRPKGVGVPHKAISRLITNTNYIALGPTDVVAQAASFSFDAATFEIWGALLHGATLVILPEALILSPEHLATRLKARGITTLFLTTAVFNLMARQVPAAFKPLRHVLFGGEEVDPRSVRAVLLNGPPGRLIHVYGPTETTTFATWHLVEAVDSDTALVPIGRPIANTQAYILDRHREPVPIGVTGELHLGGPGLARGYLHRPDLTAERFVTHPFSLDPDARLYRTGDMARFLADGSIVFIGRRDGQVKIRGYRIEMGEVEHAITRTGEVSQAA